MGEAEEKMGDAEAFLFLLCACFSGNGYKTDGKMKWFPENQNAYFHLYCTVNTLIFLCSAKKHLEAFLFSKWNNKV